MTGDKNAHVVDNKITLLQDDLGDGKSTLLLNPIPKWKKLKSVSALAEEECRKKALQYGERMLPRRWNGIPMPSVVSFLLGYKTVEKKEQDDGQKI